MPRTQLQTVDLHCFAVIALPTNCHSLRGKKDLLEEQAQNRRLNARRGSERD